MADPVEVLDPHDYNIQERMTIGVVLENRFLAVTSRRGVIERTRKLKAANGLAMNAACHCPCCRISLQ